METTNTASLTRRANDWILPPELRTLLKANLGLNARQVSVARRSSNQYLTITVRDAAVDIAAVEAFAAKLHTWTMDQSDYCEGQSIHVVTTKEVDAIHAAPFVAEILAGIAQLEARQGNGGEGLPSGCVLWSGSQGYYVTRGDARRNYIWTADVAARAPYAIQALALSVARLSTK